MLKYLTLLNYFIFQLHHSNLLIFHLILAEGSKPYSAYPVPLNRSETPSQKTFKYYNPLHINTRFISTHTTVHLG